MTQPAQLSLEARTNAPYDEEIDLTLDGAALDLTGWTNLAMRLNLEGTTTEAFTLAQVSTAVAGLRPLSPLSDGVIRIRVDRTTLEVVPSGTGKVVLTGDLMGDDAEGLRRTVAVVTLTLTAGTTP